VKLIAYASKRTVAAFLEMELVAGKQVRIVRAGSENA
jgi:hypothetical protein